MQSRKIRIGSRESRLAVIQSKLVMDTIRRVHPELELELVTMKTTGDMVLDRPLDKIGGKGLFVKELDQALLDGRIDLSVHSLKDMPMQLPYELPIVAYTRRADPHDVLILPQGTDCLDPEKPIGCSSARRCLQLRKLYPQMRVESVRGNVITRLAKLDRGDYSALVLAHAGISRLGLDERISRVFSASEMIPAAGQGIIAVQGRAGEDFYYLNSVNDISSQACAAAERSFVRTLNGGCSSPIAAYAEVSAGELLLTGLYYDEQTNVHTIGSIRGETAQAQSLGEQLAQQLGGIG